jgi:hypothetical protein
MLPPPPLWLAWRPTAAVSVGFFKAMTGRSFADIALSVKPCCSAGLLVPLELPTATVVARRRTCENGPC